MLKIPDRNDGDDSPSDEFLLKIYHGCLGTLIAAIFMAGLFVLASILLWKLL